MHDIQNCDFHAYDEDKLMKETANYVRLLQRGGTLEILIPYAAQQRLSDI